MIASRLALLASALALAGTPSLASAQSGGDDAAARRDDPAAVAAMVKARQHFFGPENVDERTGRIREDKVIFSWFGVASFAVAAKGRVFFLDSYIYRLADRRAYVPATVQDLVDLRPEAIFIGHGHGDHADNAAYIAGLTGATIYGAAEHCTAMQGDASRIFGAGTMVRCQPITTPGSAPGAEVRTLRALAPDLCITAWKHVHSALVPVDPTLPRNPINAVRDPRVDTLFPPNPPPSRDTRTMAGAGGAVSIMYQFTVGGSDFTFTWHDTAGPLKEQAPALLQFFTTLPKTDVQLGAGVSIGEANNGVRDITMYINALQPKVFFMTHTDNFNIGASMFYVQAIQRQFDIFAIPAADRPEIRGLHDPYDYVRPGLMTFDYRNDYWRDGRRGNRHSRYCAG
ncbi:hypothetical protein CURE108131_16235 [Cupriavidus respiraculi]|uniref:MBL fold metallo-hydrolase n=1 Tax=Cupriavidus respiraculi TaxID=195930 RepID=A0ABM8WLL7_9BURK|nr:hypothetical protein [Cupriavidus respiraculi]CAG9168259.1 hypothetical protein LMG21510_01013 [Cupriavidus respiraculi]